MHPDPFVYGDDRVPVFNGPWVVYLWRWDRTHLYGGKTWCLQAVCQATGAKLCHEPKLLRTKPQAFAAAEEMANLVGKGFDLVSRVLRAHAWRWCPRGGVLDDICIGIKQAPPPGWTPWVGHVESHDGPLVDSLVPT